MLEIVRQSAIISMVDIELQKEVAKRFRNKELTIEQFKEALNNTENKAKELINNEIKKQLRL